MRVRALGRAVAIAAAVLSVLLVAGVRPVHAATAIGSGGCAASALTLPAAGATTPSITSSDCRITFGSSSSTAMLRLSQVDQAGVAMAAAPDGDLDDTFDGQAGFTGHPGNGTFSFAPGVTPNAAAEVLVDPQGRTYVLGTINNAAQTVVVRLTDVGAYDTSWGTGGIAIVPGGSDAIHMALQADGKLLVATEGTEAYLSRFTTAGDLDVTFDGDERDVTYPGNGTVRCECVYTGASNYDWPGGIALQPDGRIVEAMTSTDGSNHWDLAVIRRMPDGRRDNSFGRGGVARIPLGTGTEYDTATGVLVRPDGRIVLGGFDDSRVGVIQLLADGTLDTAGFGSGTGRVTYATEGAGFTIIDEWALDSQGRIVGAGYVDTGWDGNDVRQYVIRLQPDGSIDTDFNSAGTPGRIVRVPGTTWNPGTWEYLLTGLHVDPLTDAITVAGRDFNGTDAESVVLRYTSTGVLDTTFATGGIDVRDQAPGASDRWSGLGASSDRRLVVVGSTAVGSGEFAVARYAASALPDYEDGVNDFDQGTGAFGACVRSTSGLGVVAGWPTTGSCTAVDGTNWNAIPAGSSAAGIVARSTTSGVVGASASLRFGAVAGAGVDAGDYAAQVAIEVIAPSLEAPAYVSGAAVNGTSQVRRSLTANVGTWTGSGPIAYSYQWRRCDAAGANCVDIAGETSASYVLVAIDAGSTIRVEITATNGEGSATTTTAQTAVVAAYTPTIPYMTGFEHGTVAAFTPMGEWVGGTPTMTSTAVRNGSRSLELDEGDEWNTASVGNQPVIVARSYVRFDQLPSSGRMAIINVTPDTPNFDIAVGVGSDRFYASANDGVTIVSGSPAVVGRWYRVDMRVDMSSATWSIDWSIDGVPQPSTSRAGMYASNDNSVSFAAFPGIGSWGGITGSIKMRVDDVAVSPTASSYPLGDGKALAFLPSGIGSITTPGNYSYFSNPPNAWNNFVAGDANASPGRSIHLDDWPVVTGAANDMVRQQTAGGSLEVQLSDTTEPFDPTAIRVSAALRESAAGTSNNTLDAMLCTPAPCAATSNVYSRNAAGTALEYGAATLSTKPGGGNWTTADLNNLRLGISSSNSTVDPYTDALIVEADFPAIAAPVNLTQPTIEGTTSVGQVLTTDTGTWSDASSYAYQWLRCDADGSGCAPIGGATSATYTLVAGDLGKRIHAQVTASNGGGNQTAWSAVEGVVGAAAPSIVHTAGFEHGTDLTGLNGNQNVGLARWENQFDAPVSAAAAIERGVGRTGGNALRVRMLGLTSGSTTGYIYQFRDGPLLTNQSTTRFSFMMEQLPQAGSSVIWKQGMTTAGWNMAFLTVDSSGLVTARMDEGTDVGSTVIEPWRWYTVDLRLDGTGSPARLDWMLDGVQQPQSSDVLEDPVDISDTEFGLIYNSLNTTTTVRFDDLAISSSNADYPLAHGRSTPLLPDANGVNSTPGSFGYSTDHGLGFTALVAGDDNAVPGVAQYLDDWPNVSGASADLTRQTATAGYMQVTVGDSSETVPPNAVRVTGAFEEASLFTVQSVEVRARAGTAGATMAAIAALDPDSSGGFNTYGAGTLATKPGGGPWTVDALNDLVLEVDSVNVGGASTQRPWTNALLVEADTTVAAPPTSQSPPGIDAPYATLKVGDELTGTPGTWSNDGLGYSTFTWLRCAASGESCVPISGAVGSTYTLQAADVGSRIRVLERREGSHRANQTARSAASGMVAESVSTAVADVNGFETGVVEHDATGFGLGTYRNGTAPTVTTAAARNGDRSLRYNLAGASGVWGMDWNATSGVKVMSFGLYLGALPSTGTAIAEIDTSGTSNAELRLSPTGQLVAQHWTPAIVGAQAGPTLAVGRWYQIDIRVDTSTTTHRIDWMVDGVTQASSVRAGGVVWNSSWHQVGPSTTGTFDLMFDDIATSGVAGAYPIGPLAVEPLAFGGAGTHSGAGNFSNDDASAIDATSAGRLDELPMTSAADFVRQQTASVGSYLEWTLADPARTDDAWLVSVVYGFHASSATANSAIVKAVRLGDSDAGAPVVSSGNHASTSLLHRDGIITPPSAGWTFAELAGLKVRTGYRSGAGGIPYWDSVMAEVAYRE